MERITVNGAALKRAMKAVTLAGARKSPLVPTHWSETILIEPVSDKGVMLLCCDGYRMHEIRLYHTFATYEESDRGHLVLGTTWMQEFLKNVHPAQDVVIEGEAKADPRALTDVWKVVAETPTDHAEQDFDIFGQWPGRSSIIDFDQVTIDAVGFNPDFFNDLMKAMMAWWDKDTPDAAFPMVVKQLHPQKVGSFTLTNSMGVLKASLMPKILKEEEQ